MNFSGLQLDYLRLIHPCSFALPLENLLDVSLTLFFGRQSFGPLYWKTSGSTLSSDFFWLFVCFNVFQFLSYG
eukprot:UN33138